MIWAVAYLPVPRVVTLEELGGTTVLVTEALGGRDATDPSWRGDLPALVHAMGQGLRRFHEAVDEEWCPFPLRPRPRARPRGAASRQRRHRRQLPRHPRRLHPRDGSGPTARHETGRRGPRGLPRRLLRTQRVARRTVASPATSTWANWAWPIAGGTWPSERGAPAGISGRSTRLASTRATGSSRTPNGSASTGCSTTWSPESPAASSSSYRPSADRHRAQASASAITCVARVNTASNIDSVSFPVNVFCWLGWYEPSSRRPSGSAASARCPKRGLGRIP